MNNWFRLGDFVIDSLKGITPRYVDNSSIIVLNQKCIRNNRIDYSFSRFHDPNKTFNESKILRIGDLLFNSTGQGTAGRCAFVSELPDDKKVITDSHILIIRIDDYYLSNSFNYSLFKEEKFIQSFMDGSTGQGELDKLRLFNMEFRLPNEKRRKNICDFIHQIDQKIELNNQINTELESLAKLVYDYWFVQFDFPMSASDAAALGKPELEGKPYKASGGKMVFNEMLKREIPEGWEVIPLSSKATFANGKGISKNEFRKDGRYKVFGSNGKTGRSDKQLFNKPVIIVGRVGANYGAVNYSADPCWVSDNAITAQSLEEYSFWWILITLRQIEYSSIAGGSAQPLITQGKLKNLFIPAPEINCLLKLFDSFVNPLFQRIEVCKNENQELAELRDWLLPMLMNGQVTVEDAYEKVEKKLGMVAEDNQIYELFKNDTYLQKSQASASRKNAPKQAMILALAIDAHSKVSRNLYRTKGEKLIEVIEKHLSKEFGRVAKKMAAGPAAFKHLVTNVEPLATKNDWFTVESKPTSSDRISYKYVKGSNFNAFLKRAQFEFKSDILEVNRIIHLFVNVETTKKAEIIATTYSGWNNLIIRDVKITNESIVDEARENWHKSKLKISRAEFKEGIKWLRSNNLIPKGNGKEVR